MPPGQRITEKKKSGKKVKERLVKEKEAQQNREETVKKRQRKVSVKRHDTTQRVG